MGTPSRGGNDCQRVVPGPAVGRSEVPPDGHPQYRLSVPQYTITTTMYALNATERREKRRGRRWSKLIQNSAEMAWDGSQDVALESEKRLAYSSLFLVHGLSGTPGFQD